MVHYSVSAAVGIDDVLALLRPRPLAVCPQDPDKTQLTRTKGRRTSSPRSDHTCPKIGYSAQISLF